MSRFHGGSNSHSIKRLGNDEYEISWSVDRYSRNSRIRTPVGFWRVTDFNGAVKFAKKWDCLRVPECIAKAVSGVTE